MASTTVSDYVIWAKHIHDDPELVQRVLSMWAGETIHLEVDGVRGVDLITSNFAPLNLIEDLPELFEKFHALTGPGGRVLASVLSPVF